MKITKLNSTVLCLTAITITEILYTGGGGFSVLLWIGYGVYKLESNN